ncbi:MAG TPA: hypothetical protein VGI63_00165 [Verrucomicrobiae bacterium]|jgi:Spy/CpxP family protein refolding chaperone
MKLTKTLALAALVAGSLFAGSTLQAQNSTNTPPAGTPPGMRARPNFEQLSKQLELTDDQKPKVKAVTDDMMQKMRDLRQETSLSQEDRRAKVKEIRDASNAKLKEILTADQYAKWQKMGAGNRRPPGGQPPSGDNAPKKD